MSNRTLLLEIGLEEMPARFVTNAMNQLKQRVEKWFESHRLSYSKVEAYSTPRRLAVVVDGLVEKQEDMEEEAKGPSKKIAIDDAGEWSKAAQGFARGQGATVNDLYFKELKGEEYVFLKKHTSGEAVQSLLPELKEVILSIPFPKNMKWGTNDLRFVRPVKWIVALFGEEVVPFDIAGIHTNRVTYGHRFLGSKVEVKEADHYVQTLLKEFVIVDPLERKKAIRTQIERMAEEENWSIFIDEDLLEEVNNLVEYPTALYGSFDERFLTVPDDVLITSMREHQRYFPVKNGAGELLPYFVTVRNGDHRHLENVQKGNEKVLRARLADSEFFYQEDLRKNFASLFDRLEAIVYHEELGSVADKVRRVKDLAVKLADKAGATEVEKQQTERAARLSKVDLVTHMVNEFPELEGRMGEEYALKAGEHVNVAQAIREHYLPKQSGDPLPQSSISAYVAVADKLDTLVTSFGIGNIPTGSQDPHGLRRQTAGILQIFLSEAWSFDLFTCIEEAIDLAAERDLLKRSKQEIIRDLTDFVKLRYKSILQDQGIRYDVVDAILKTQLGRVTIVVRKGKFLMEQLSTPSFKNDVEAFSRVTNIAKKAEDKKAMVDKGLFQEKQEKELQTLAEEKQDKLLTLLNESRIEEAYDELKSLEPAIHDYFDHVMVMADDPKVKQNRLSQMVLVAKTITSFADFQTIVFHS
ncbi:glycine--tRNA ligase subunit beta [Salipaludibacillus keqinensis]|uniref:Glycine--tRNA ligase beta subunit n=1 Tax=Salipaludibacillus keqinensis TaxID=2045207 RepID=A0A323TI97_9BACI|nr:glycine--tRNA ligase subunit beta [Salipaludibacillus keqinensis]PYZ94260.1 glycine--tRNA ligase subunit beta [Salipaludibacillus keqinensis]